MFEKHYETVVCGGGVAGVAAALASARRGIKTCLIEKTIQPGGLATGGLVLIYLPLCDGKGTQVTFGICEELIRASNKFGPKDLPSDLHEKRMEVLFSPASFILAMDELLTDAGVDIWYDTVITGAELKDQRITGVNVFNKSGHGVIRGNTFIDATGDTDVASAAGLPCLEADNSLVTWVIEKRGKATFPHMHFSPDIMVRVAQKPDSGGYTAPGINGRMVSGYVLDNRRYYRELLEKNYAEGESRYDLYPLHLPSVPTLRHTRCLKGTTVLQPGLENTACADSIGLAADWRCAGKVWEIPWSSLFCGEAENLLAAGRCSSAYGDAWEITRVIPTAAMTGEVAGVAAALAVQENCPAAKLDYALLAGELLDKCGFLLHLPDAGLTYRQ